MRVTSDTHLTIAGHPWRRHARQRETEKRRWKHEAICLSKRWYFDESCLMSLQAGISRPSSSEELISVFKTTESPFDK
jgi:hypothetical protein